MAYHDENGKLTIDEAAANRDIKRLREAANILKDSRASIRSLRQQSTDMQGLAAQAIQEKSTEMEKKLTQMIDKLEDTADYIQKVVKRYQKIDEDLKKLIERSVQAMKDAQEKMNASSGLAGSVNAGNLDWGRLGDALKSIPGSKK